MQLEWFRTHKKFVYWILLPAVGGTMPAFFGVGMRNGAIFGKIGAAPDVRGWQDRASDGTAGSHRGLRTRYSKYFPRRR